MVSRYKNSAYGFPKKQQNHKRTGYRFPRFDGARTTQANEGVALSACPILPGETVTRLQHSWHVGRTDNDNADQSMAVEWATVFVPFAIGGGTTLKGIGTGEIDAMFEYAFNKGASMHQFGGEPNPGADHDFLGLADWAQIEVLWHVFRLAHSHANTGRLEDEIGQVDDLGSRIVDYGNATISRNFRFEEPGFIISGILRSQQSAQTDFGVAEVDSSLEPIQLARALSGVESTEGDASADKARELFFGGDTYIEANTRVTGAAHASMMSQYVIKTRYDVIPD